MRILDRYITKNFLFLLCGSIISLWIIYVIFELLGEVNLLIQYKPNLFVIIQYYLLKSPFMIVEVCPYAILITTLLSLYHFSRHNELISMQIAGISLYRITLPIFVISFILSFIIFGLNNRVVSFCNQKIKNIKKTKIEKEVEDYFCSSRYNVTLTSQNNTLYHIKFYDAERTLMSEVNIFKLDQEHRLKERIDAERAKWQNGKWYFSNGTIYFPKTKETHSFQYKTIPLKETPEDFAASYEEPDGMNYKRLKDYTNRLSKAGFDMRKNLVDLYKKIAFPFANFIIVFLGIPFAIHSQRAGTAAKGFGISLIIYIIYWYTMAIAEALGKNGILPPLLSVWLANLIFLTLGIFFLIKKQK